MFDYTVLERLLLNIYEVFVPFHILSAEGLFLSIKIPVLTLLTVELTASVTYRM